MPIGVSRSYKISLCLGTPNRNRSSEILRGTRLPSIHSATFERQAAKKDEVPRILSSAKLQSFDIRYVLPNFPTNISQHYQNDGRLRQVAALRAGHQQQLPQGGADAGESTESSKQKGGGLVGRVVAFTTPLQYAGRFGKLLREKGAEPLWCPTIVTEQTDQTRQELEQFVGRPGSKCVFQVSGVAFTSRAGIRAISEVLDGRQLPLDGHDRQNGEELDSPFLLGALGKDAELLKELNVIPDSPRVFMIVPAVSTPQALVEALGTGNGRKILCPVPLVEGVEEPPVVPQFLEELRQRGWDPVRVNSYVTRWLGSDCAKPLLVMNQIVQFASIDALVFTSTAEIDGLLKSCRCLGLDGVQALQRRSRKFIVACHGPVTALGAERLGVEVDVVGEEFQSFDGVIKAVGARFRDTTQN